MRIIIQKFGGTSLSTKQAKEHVISHIKRERDNGYAVVVVVSAMGRSPEPYATDSLLQLVDKYSNCIDYKELDLLMSCGETISAVSFAFALREAGIPAVAFTAAEAGIETDAEFGSAKIVAIKPDQIIAQLEKGRVVIVTGFQGRTSNGDITTLGRGGSDTSATALGAALKAEMVDIYTDVNGVLTADPRLVNEAKPITQVSYAEICHMAREGAKVIHPRAVEIAQQARIPMRIRSTFTEDEGTLVQDYEWMHNEHYILDRHVTGIAHVSGVAQIIASQTKTSVETLVIFETLAENGISVDFINVNRQSAIFTVSQQQAERAMELLKQQGLDVQVRVKCAKISIIGGGMNGQPGVMAKIIKALSKKNISILQSADSNAAIWILVAEQDMVEAMVALHAMFDLHR